MTLPLDERLRYSSVEERLAAIKQLCHGLEGVRVQFDSINIAWVAEAPVKVNDDTKTTATGRTPDEAINKLWALLTEYTITITYPDKEDKQFKWDGQRWVML